MFPGLWEGSGEETHRTVAGVNRCPGAEDLRSTTRQKTHRTAGDFCVEITVQLEAGMRDMESAAYCKLFLPKEIFSRPNVTLSDFQPDRNEKKKRNSSHYASLAMSRRSSWVS